MSGSYTWNGGNGDWYDANWDAPGDNMPGPPPPTGSSVVIGNGSTVTLAPGDANPDANVFIDDGTLTVTATGISFETLTLAGIDTGAEIDGSGTVDVANFFMGAKYLNGIVSSGYIGGSLTVVITGTGNIGGTLGIDQIGDNSGSTAALQIAAGALLSIDDSAGLGADANGILVNDGTLEKLAAANGPEGTSLITTQITNIGTIQVDAGVLQFGGSAIALGGTLDGAGVLDLTGTGTLESDLVLLATGVTLEIDGDTTLDQVAAAIPAGDTFLQIGGTLSAATLLPAGTSDLVIDGTAVLSAGELVDSTTTFPASPDLTIGATGTLDMPGFTSFGTFTGGYELSGGAYIVNDGQATIGAEQDNGYYSALEYDYSTSATYANQGTTTLEDANITSVLGAPSPGYNYGFFYNYGTLININDQTAASNAAQTNTVQVFGFANYGGTIDVQSGSMDVNLTFGTFQGGSFEGSGTLGLGGGFSNVQVSIEFGATSDVATLDFDPFGNGTYDIGQDFTQNGVLDIGDGGGAATLHLDTDVVLAPTPVETTLTVTGATNVTNGVLEVGTLLTQGGIDMSDYRDFFEVSGATLENAGSGTILGNIELSEGTLAENGSTPGTLLNDAGGVITLGAFAETADLERYASITGDDSTDTIVNNGTLLGDGPAAYGSPPLFSAIFNGPEIAATIVNDGVIEAEQGALLLAGPAGSSITGTGSIAIDANAAVEIAIPVSGNEVVFSGADGLLQIDDLSNAVTGPIVQDFNADIGGFAAGDTIVLSDIAYQGATISVAPDNSSVTIMSNGVAEGTLDFDPPAGTFQLSNVGGDAALTLMPAPCYCRGTSILTDRGERQVEDLRIGDLVVTASGRHAPIRWIGTRSYVGRFVEGRRDILPVRIARGALADNVPHRDLSVSPMHAMYLQGNLVPAVALVNGVSIVQAASVETVDYFNIELSAHDVILAEGAASETFIDDGSRLQFQNAAEYAALYPDVEPAPPVYFAPRLEEGETLAAICAGIAVRAGIAAAAKHGRLQGRLDLANHEVIAGWARDRDHPDAPVRLRILANGRVLCDTVADQFRQDLRDAGIGDGFHAFSVPVPGELARSARHLIEVRSADGQVLENTPFVLEAPAGVAAIAETPANWQGKLELVTHERIAGWAWDSAQPASQLRLQLLIDGEVVTGILANRFRQDLVQAGIGNGQHGFSLLIPGGLSPLSRHVIRVVSEADGADMPNSPFVLEPSAAFDTALEHTVQAAVTALAGAGPDRQAQVLAFLAAQAERLLQLQADTQGGWHARLLQRQFRREARRDLPSGDLRALVVAADYSLTGCAAQIHALQDMGYEVCLATSTSQAPHESELTALDEADILVCRAPFTASVEDVLRRQANCIDLIYLHGPAIAQRYAALAQSYAPSVRIIATAGHLARLHATSREQASVG